MLTLDGVIVYLVDKSVAVTVVADKLRFRADPPIPAPVVEAIRYWKPELFAMLTHPVEALPVRRVLLTERETVETAMGFGKIVADLGERLLVRTGDVTRVFLPAEVKPLRAFESGRETVAARGAIERGV